MWCKYRVQALNIVLTADICRSHIRQHFVAVKQENLKCHWPVPVGIFELKQIGKSEQLYKSWSHLEQRCMAHKE